jgi:hypothetical protein
MNRDDLEAALSKLVQELGSWGNQGVEALRRWARQGVLTAAVVGFVIVYPIVLIGLAGFVRPAPRVVEQPVAFNHRIHVQDLELACTDCHQFYETETFSGLPEADTCAMCHEEAQSQSGEEAKLVSLLSEGGPLEWQSLFAQPAHVFYSHSRHVTVAGIECDQCHGLIGESETPPRKVELLSMDACIDCHQQRQASTDCTDCHR